MSLKVLSAYTQTISCECGTQYNIQVIRAQYYVYIAHAKDEC